MRHATGELAVELGEEAKINMEDVFNRSKGGSTVQTATVAGLSCVVLSLQTATAIVECETRVAL